MVYNRKRLWVFILILLAACRPASTTQPAQTGSADGQPGSLTPVEVQGETPGITDGDKGAPVQTQNGSRSEDLAWDPAAETRLISAVTSGGFVPRLYMQNALPDALLLGDGRIIWVLQKEDGSRQVLEGFLSQTQMQDLLDQFDATGFFGWRDRYADPGVTDAPDQCLVVNLKSGSKSVCEYVSGAPPAFHTLYDLMASGAGAEGEPYTPARAFLTSYPVGKVGQDVAQVNLELPEDSQLRLSDYAQGDWVEGSDLETAWQQVNASPFGMIIQQGNTYYQISVQVPGLNLEQPPAASP